MPGRRCPVHLGAVHSARAGDEVDCQQVCVPAGCGVSECTSFVGEGEEEVGKQKLHGSRPLR